MRKRLHLFAAALLMSLAGFAQDETLPVHTKALNSVIADAEAIVASEDYTEGKTALQEAITTATSGITELANDAAVREAIVTLQAAIDQFLLDNEDGGRIADATAKVTNPSFDKDGNNSKTVTGWVVNNFKQNRRSVSYPGTSSTSMVDFIEQWANATALSGSGDIHQVLSGLPAGHYRLTADILTVSQKTADLVDLEGVQLYANESIREIGLSGTVDQTQAVTYSVDVVIAESEDLTIGFRFDNTNINWLGWDNIKLSFIGDAEAYQAQQDAELLAAAKATLSANIEAAKALIDANHPLYNAELNTAIESATAALEAETIDDVQAATDDLAKEVNLFNDFNKSYVNFLAAIEKAQALLADESYTQGRADLETAISAAQAALPEGVQYPVGSAENFYKEARATLEVAQSQFLVANASYQHPANVITNGGMSNTNGWDILVPGANPGLHINASGNVENFSKPFMECWVNNTNYGQENYAKQTIDVLPDGTPLPAGYYVLKAACLATRQDQPSLEVSGVTLRIGDESVNVHTANGVANIYTIGYEQATAGDPITFGLFIDAETDANWIAWDEVELQYVGDKDAYLAEYTKAILGESLSKLQAEVDKVQQMLTTVDVTDADIDDLNSALENAQDLLDNPLSATIESLEEALDYLVDSEASFSLSGAKPINGNFFDFTSLITNPNFDIADASGWQTAEPTAVDGMVLPSGTDCAYWWFGGSTTMSLLQDFRQTIANMPAGNYLLDVNASIRLDMTYSTSGYTEENKYNNYTRCQVYANEKTADVHPFFYEDEAKGLTLESMLAMTNDYDYRHGNGTLINDMLKASGLFHVLVPFTLEERGDITMGFLVELPKRNGQMPFIDSFALTFYGDQDVAEVTGIKTIRNAQGTIQKADTPIYNLAGQRLLKLQKGINIVNGKKVVVK